MYIYIYIWKQTIHIRKRLHMYIYICKDRWIELDPSTFDFCTLTFPHRFSVSVVSAWPGSGQEGFGQCQVGQVARRSLSGRSRGSEGLEHAVTVRSVTEIMDDLPHDGSVCICHINGNIYHQYTPNVSIYTIHGSYGFYEVGVHVFFWGRREMFCWIARSYYQHMSISDIKEVLIHPGLTLEPVRWHFSDPSCTCLIAGYGGHDMCILYQFIWLVVWNIFFIFPYIGNVIIPIDVHIFQRGGPTTNQFIYSVIKFPMFTFVHPGERLSKSDRPRPESCRVPLVPTTVPCRDTTRPRFE